MAELLGLDARQNTDRTITRVTATLRSPQLIESGRDRRKRQWTQLWLTDCSKYVRVGKAVPSGARPQQVAASDLRLPKQTARLDARQTWYFFTQVRYEGRGEEDNFSNSWSQRQGETTWRKDASIRSIKGKVYAEAMTRLYIALVQRHSTAAQTLRKQAIASLSRVSEKNVKRKLANTYWFGLAELQNELAEHEEQRAGENRKRLEQHRSDSERRSRKFRRRFGVDP